MEDVSYICYGEGSNVYRPQTTGRELFQFVEDWLWQKAGETSRSCRMWKSLISKYKKAGKSRRNAEWQCKMDFALSSLKECQAAYFEYEEGHWTLHNAILATT